MEETRNTAAFILNRQPYRESDSLVTVYTADAGKLFLLARGTKKLKSKLAGHLEPLTLADIMIIRGKSRDYIGSAITRETYPGVREDLNKLYYAGQALSLFNRLVKENQADERLFFLLGRWLETLNEFSVEAKDESNHYSGFRKQDGELLLSFFILRLAAELGYKPEISKCLSCGKNILPGQNFFSLMEGGIICGACFADIRKKGISENEFLTISDNCVKIVRFIMDNGLKMTGKLKIERKLAKELYNLTTRFLDFRF